MAEKTAMDQAKTGGGIGDIPAQPLNPATVGSGSTDPRHAGDGVVTHESGQPDADDDQGRPTRSTII